MVAIRALGGVSVVSGLRSVCGLLPCGLLSKMIGALSVCVLVRSREEVTWAFSFRPVLFGLGFGVGLEAAEQIWIW